MNTEEYKRIADLLDRFFEGQTSNEEERALYFSPVRTYRRSGNVIRLFSPISRMASPRK